MRLDRSLIVDALLVAAALAVATSVFVQRRGDRPLTLEQNDWRAVLKGGSVLAAADDGITLVEFLDYQCPACRIHEGMIAQLEQEHPQRLRRVVRHLPLSRNVRSDTAAYAAVCADQQNRFPEMHAALFASPGLLEAGEWDSLAVLSNVEDRKQFQNCLRSEESRTKVLADIATASRFGVSGTPTFVLDPEWLSGINPTKLREVLLERMR